MEKYLKLAALVAGVVICLCAGAAPAYPQQQGGAKGGDDGIAREQEKAERELKHLEELMLEIAKRIEKNEPENARKLREAWKAIRENLILEDMKAIKEALQRGKFISPFNKSKKVADNLLKVLDQLTGIVRKRAHEGDLSKLEDWISRIIELERRQTELLDRTNGGEYKNLAPGQGDLKRDTHGLAGEVLGSSRKGTRQDKAGRLLGTAGRNMGQAQDKLAGGIPGAQKHQQDALDNLRGAREELQKLKGEIEDWEELQTLVNIREKLEKMLEHQLRINRRTRELNSKVLESELTRGERIEIRRMAGLERSLWKEAVELAKKLDEEKAYVFAAALRNAAADMKEVSELLGRPETGKYTQYLQNEIVTQLRRLIEALKEVPRPPRPELPDDPPIDPPDDPPDPPLVPPVAQLKLLRQLESEIHEKTKELHRAVKQTPGGPNFIQKKIINRLAHSQSRLTEMTRKLRESLRR